MRNDTLLPSRASAASRRRLASPHSIDQLNKAISHIYDAAVDSEQWPAALREVLRFVGSSGTHLWLMNGETSEVTHSIHVGMPDKLIEEYNGEVIKECPRWANARKHPDRTFLFDYQHIDEREIDSNEYYDWLQTNGDYIRYYLGGRLRGGDGVGGFQSLAFRKKEGHAQQRHLERFAMILPHVEHAMQIGQRLGTWQFFSRVGFEVLDRLEQGVVILDDSAKVIAVNRCAERLLKPPYRISLRTNRLAARDAAVDRLLYALLGRCAATSTATAQYQGGKISIPADHGVAALQVHVYPLKLPLDTFKSGRSAVVVFLLGPRSLMDFDDAAIATAFGLTVAETRLTVALVKGATVKEASKKLKISPNTTRTQLKSIFAKIGIHRQADLVRVVLQRAW